MRRKRKRRSEGAGYQSIFEIYTEGFEFSWPFIFLIFSLILGPASVIIIEQFYYDPKPYLGPIVTECILFASTLIISNQWVVSQKQREIFTKYIADASLFSARQFVAKKHELLYARLIALAQNWKRYSDAQVAPILTAQERTRNDIEFLILNEHYLQRTALGKGAVDVRMEYSPSIAYALASHYSRMDAVSYRDVEFWHDMATGDRYHSVLVKALCNKAPGVRESKRFKVINRIFILRKSDLLSAESGNRFTDSLKSLGEAFFNYPMRNANLDRFVKVLSEQHKQGIGFAVVFEDTLDPKTIAYAEQEQCRYDFSLWDRDNAVSFFYTDPPARYKTYFKGTDDASKQNRSIHAQRELYVYLLFEAMIANERFCDSLDDGLSEEEMEKAVHLYTGWETDESVCEAVTKQFEQVSAQSFAPEWISFMRSRVIRNLIKSSDIEETGSRMIRKALQAELRR